MKIAIIGASGFIGSALYYSFLKKIKKSNLIGTYYKNYIPGTHYFDASNPDNIKDFFQKFRDIDFIILSHGSKDLAKCESDYASAYENNVQQTINIVKSAKYFNKRTKIIFISSNYVFDGKRGLYEEYDKKNPKTIYGKTKSLAEDYLFNQDIPWTIVRTSSVIGLRSTFIKWIKQESKNKKRISLYNNVKINPTPLTMLTEFFNLLIFDTQPNYINNQIFHFVSKEIESKYSFVINNYETLGLKVKIDPIINKSSLYFENLTLKASDKFYSKLASSSIKYLKESLTEK